MCNCGEKALEYEPEIRFGDLNGQSVFPYTQDWIEYQVVGVKLKGYEYARDDIAFIVRAIS